mmetsp:Transcript_49449/g.146055  ORF Transcript_49449/g.146055 Transcript_49449/m.146055 type:complete len:323 (+) Transcript_49449:96-1064(+)
MSTPPLFMKNRIMVSAMGRLLVLLTTPIFLRLLSVCSMTGSKLQPFSSVRANSSLLAMMEATCSNLMLMLFSPATFTRRGGGFRLREKLTLAWISFSALLSRAACLILARSMRLMPCSICSRYMRCRFRFITSIAMLSRRSASAFSESSISCTFSRPVVILWARAKFCWFLPEHSSKAWSSSSLRSSNLSARTILTSRKSSSSSVNWFVSMGNFCSIVVILPSVEPALEAALNRAETGHLDVVQSMRFLSVKRKRGVVYRMLTWSFSSACLILSGFHSPMLRHRACTESVWLSLSFVACFMSRLESFMHWDVRISTECGFLS